MTAIFDGLSGVLNSTFGAPVIHTPQGGVAVTIRAVFRAGPIEVATEDGGSVLITAPSLRVRLTDAPNIARGDTVAPSIAPGETFRVLNTWPSRSPAVDRFVLCELEKIA